MWKTIIQLCFVFCFFLIPTPRFLIAQIKIMPLGDSISKGVSGPSTDDAGYRDDLAEFLTSEGIDFDFVGSLAHGAGFDSEHEGHDGFRADQILDNIASYLSANPPDMILLHLGTNDISSDQTPESTRDEIGALVDEIHAFNPDIKIVLSSLIPRIDERDETTTALNQLLFTLTASKREAGVQIFYAGMNEIFKCNSNWDADYFTPTDIVHPNDAGFHLMAQVWFYAVTTAMNVGADLSVTDNFERSSLGAPWDTDPEFEIRSGNLVNTAKDGTKRWQYMAAFKGVMNPTHVAIRWSAKANKRGIRRGGLALLLDSASQDASGFLAYITTEDNMLRLWTIENGVAGEDLNLDVKSQTGPPAAGDKFGVTIAGDTDSLRFDYFVNDVFAGRITTGNSGLGGNFYAGVIVRHNRRNDIAEFFAEGSGDFEQPAQIEDLNPIEVSATSVVLTWTAPGDDGHNGRAFQYDVRYSLSPIDTENDFKSAIQVNEAPAPTAAGTPQSFVDLNLEPETTYYFALQVFDEAGNPSPVSNVASFTTADGELLTDDFNRSGLGPDWSHAPTLEISNDEMVNSSIEP
ncbi:MAG: GDSL-type esterase/lipase family protein, partial [bacterium]